MSAMASAARLLLIGATVVLFSSNDFAQPAPAEDPYRAVAELVLAEDLDGAIQLLQALAQQQQDAGNAQAAALTQFQLGRTYLQQAEKAASTAKTRDELGRAKGLYQSAADALVSVQGIDRALEIEAHEIAARLHRDFLDDATAGRLYSEAAAYHQVEGNTDSAIAAAESAADVFSKAISRSEDPAAMRARAIAAYEQALTLRRMSAAGVADSDYAEGATTLASLYVGARNKELAARWYRNARESYALQNDVKNEAIIILRHLDAYRILGNEAEVKAEIRQLFTGVDQMTAKADPQTQSLIWFVRGTLEATSAPSPAVWFKKAKDAIDSSDDPELKMRLRMALAAHYAEEKQELEAFDARAEALSMHLVDGGMEDKEERDVMRDVKLFYRGQKDAVLQHYTARAKREHENGAHAEEARLLARMGLAMTITGDAVASADPFTRAIAEDRIAGGTMPIVIAAYERRFNRYDNAIRILDEAIRSYESAGAAANHAEALMRRAQIYNEQYHEPEAAAMFERAARLYAQLQNRDKESHALLQAIRRHADVIDRGAALTTFQHARKAHQSAKDVEGEVGLLEAMADTYESWGEKEEANKLRAEAQSLTALAQD